MKQDLAVVAEVRRLVRLIAGHWGMDDFVPCLVASELVTNALRHAAASDDDVTLRMGKTEDGALWMEVQDAACGSPRPREAGAMSEAGRGLLIVDQYTRCWGVRPLAGDAGKVVFAVIDPS